MAMCLLLYSHSHYLKVLIMHLCITTIYKGVVLTVDKTFPSGSANGSTQCITMPVVDEDQIFESNPIQSYTVTLQTTQLRVTASGTTTVTVNDDDGNSTYDVLIYQLLAAISLFAIILSPKFTIMFYALTLDPVIALQQTSYTIPESTPEVDASICVVLKNPVGGLAVPFDVMFSIMSGTTSKLLDIYNISVNTAANNTTEEIVVL